MRALESRVDWQRLEMLFMLVWIDGIMKKRKSLMEESVLVDVSRWSHWALQKQTNKQKQEI